MTRTVSRSFKLRPLTLGVFVVAWIACEIAVFILVVQRIGLWGAFVLGLGALVLGVATLRRMGFAAVRHLRAAVRGEQPTAVGLLDGSLAALGAVLLIIPGFVSDVVGLALTAPSIRQWVAHRFANVARPGHPTGRVRAGTIDLAPTDWKRVEDAQRPGGSARGEL